MSKLIKYFKGDDLAASVWQGKYQQEGEETPDDMHKRLAKEFARIEQLYIIDEKKDYEDASFQGIEFLSKYCLTRDNLTERRIYNLFKDFKYIVPQGSIMSQLGANSIGSLSNCFVVGQPEDSYGGIFQKDEELAQLMKRRGGVGIDIATLRPIGTPTSNAAKTSTGGISFVHRFSNTTREVAQDGRRGALMISQHIRHPDSLEFIQAKRDLTKVTGANISVKIFNDFMEAVVADKEYMLQFPVDSKAPSITKIVKAKDYWDEIIKSAHGVAEPGLMFWDTMVDYSPDGVYDLYRQITTNPCSEIAMQAYDACRLIAVNLFSFVDKPFTEDAKFNFAKFYKYNYEAMRLSDDLIDLELEHVDRILAKISSDKEPADVKKREFDLWTKIKETAMASRRTGLGFTALGDTLAALGLKYDSDEALVIIESIMKKKMESELDCTIDLAVLRGTFTGWNPHLEVHDEIFFGNSFYEALYENFPAQFERMQRWGRRNVSWSTVAPTGTVSLLTQTTSGVEPIFQPFYTRRKKVNPNDTDVRVDFTDDNGDTWQEFQVLHPKFRDWLILNYTDEDTVGSPEEAPKEMLQLMFEKSPWYKSTANDIDWIKRVEIQSIIQKYISHSISSTINLPNDVTTEEVSEIYLESWRKGLKGITVYRDGSRSGVLVTEPTKEQFEYQDANKRPKCLPVDIFTATSLGVKYNVLVGLIDGKPYEVFAIPYFTTKSNMELCKKGKGQYDLEENGETFKENVTQEMSSEEEVVTRLISTSLRHRTDIKFIVEQLNKTDGDMFSFVKVITRILKKYIPDGAKSTVTCNDCGSSNVIFQEGCNSCLDCGSSKCG